MKSVLITGGSGSFGTAFARYLLQQHDDITRIVIYSRGEYRQYLCHQELQPYDSGDRLRFMVGDVRDRKRLERAMNGIKLVIHAAALKRIEVGHYNPIEMVRTNIDGAINVIEACQDAGVERGVFISSDKAWQPISPYGQTKALAESLFLAANNTTGWKGPRFSVCRYGNVWNSTGSFIPIWRARVARGETTVPVTDPNCTRFFMRMSEAVKLVWTTATTMKGGELVVPKLPAYRIGDVAEAMGVQMKIGKLPAYEKLHEGMEDGNTSDKARRLTIKELKDILKET